MNTDPFVRKAMKLWDEETYHSLRGYTKKASLALGLESFKMFGRHEFQKSRMPEEFRECYRKALKDAQRVFTPHERLNRVSVPDVCDKMNLDTSTTLRRRE